MDLARHSYDNKDFQFYEIKAWDSDDDLVAASTQVFIYFCLACSLSLINRANHPPLVSLRSFELRVLAPREYFERQQSHGNNFRQAFLGLKTHYPEFANLSLGFEHTVLDGISFERFFDSFDHDKIKKFLSS